MKAATRTIWTFAITSIALFMVVLDNLVVSTAIFSDGLVPALWVGAIVLGIGSVLALLVPRKRRAADTLVSEPDVLAVQAAEAA